MEKFNISLNDIKRMVNESVNVILENRESKNVALARHFLKKNGYDDARAVETLNQIKTEITNVRRAQQKFLLGVTRIWLETPNMSGRMKSNLNNTLELVASDAHVNEYDYNLNGMSLQELVDRFKNDVSAKNAEAQQASSAQVRQANPDYTIIPIDNPQAASKYGQYTSWCVTHYPGMYNSYTSNGTGRFYFCLKNGFEKVKAEPGPNCPLDEYGLSMIAVSIKYDGSPNTITCRWNHDHGGGDSVMSVKQLEELLGRNFYETFKPYTAKELRLKGIVAFEEVQEILDDGTDPASLFTDMKALGNAEGYNLVQLNKKWNVLSPDKKIVFKDWSDDIAVLSPADGTPLIMLDCNNKYIFATPTGQAITNAEITDFDRNGFNNNNICAVRISGNDKWGLLNTHGQIVVQPQFDSISTNNGMGILVGNVNGKQAAFNQDGKNITGLVDAIDVCSTAGYIIVYKDDISEVCDATGAVKFGPYDRCRFFNNDKFIDAVTEDTEEGANHILIDVATGNVIAQNFNRLRSYQGFNCTILYKNATHSIGVIDNEGHDIGGGFRYTSVSSFGSQLLFETPNSVRVMFHNGKLSSEFDSVRHNIGIKDGVKYILDYQNCTETPENPA